MHRLHVKFFIVVMALGITTSCGGDPPAGNGGGGGGDEDTSDGGGDAADEDATGGTDAADVDEDPAAEDGGGPVIDAGDLLDVGELCLADAECASRLCFRFEPGIEEGFCSSYCAEAADCRAEGFDCVFLQSSGGDFARVCVPENLCIDRDGDTWGLGPGCSGVDCDDNDDSVNPAADELCDGVDNDCDGNRDENPLGANEDCLTGFGGVCSAGRAFCVDGIIDCVPMREPSAESCDGVDNDCDGDIDEDLAGEPLAETCYNGPAGTENVGACVPGVRNCAEGRFSDCTGQILPFVEVCDGVDNDCDGSTDEGFPGAGQPCDVEGAVGVCAAGRTQCTPEGILTCAQLTFAGEELCDGVDNDCDGEVDEDEAGAPLERICFGGEDINRGIGVCRDGVQTCLDAEYGPCIDDVLPGLEVCDGVDNDCDGSIDEDGAAGGFICSTGLLGACAVGQTTCTDDGTVCVADFEPTEEICDGVDNDCDGEVDEASAGVRLERGCYAGPEGTAGVGTCEAGVQACLGREGFGTCVGQILPGSETCDGVDNDCDGNIDNGNPGGGVACPTGIPGACSVGITLCAETGSIECVQTVFAEGTETCDGVDNDCDAAIDEGDDGNPLRRTCYGGAAGTLDVGLCHSGVQICGADGYGTCIDQVVPTAEVCDGFDNDCDGTADDGNPGSGVACSTGGLGVCSVGTTTCGDGEISCVASATASAETCDGRDNDCDGDIDEDESGAALARTCYSGAAGTRDVGVCVAGRQICGADGFGACLDQITPSLEICDGDDNDCDGTADEGNPGGGVSCSTGQLGVCSVGVTLCTEGAVACDVTTFPSAETCDGRDNDCDGDIDEDESGAALARTCYSGPAGTVGVGACVSGQQVCGSDGFGTCINQVVPTLEICDGIDNDCDGQRDEGNPGGGVSCSTGALGLCAVGTTACTAGDVVCNQTITPVAETCDGRDNDCDGDVDEDAAGDALARACYTGAAGTEGVGLCHGGQQICGADGFGTCLDQVIPGVEICDGFDNDCDGEIDEGNPGGGVACSTGLAGVCSSGSTVCAGGALSCAQTTTPSAETCDGFDNDCDGAADEDSLGRPLSRSCYDGPAGTLGGIRACAAGVQTCAGGDFGTCVGQVLPSTEICDAVDNDCDGSADDGNPGGGISCNTGLAGVCAAGDTACVGGAVSCVGAITPGSQAEVCDGLDNDCDGSRDEGFTGLGTSCTTGLGICSRPGVLVCAADQVSAPVCTAATVIGNPVEQCDYVDDDCDGQVDEGYVNASGAYNTVTNCGGCGIDCNNRWPGGPALYNVAPRCAAPGSTASCAFDCLPGYVDADLVADNGCELFPESDTIYVSTPGNGGVDSVTCGAWNAPCATLAQARTRAASGIARIRVSTGVYRENVVLRDGVSLLGGHNPTNWTRNIDVYPTVIQGTTTTASGPDRIAVNASSITSATTFSGFTVNAENAAAGGNSIGVYVANSNQNLIIENNQVFAATGGNGADGSRGNQGGPGLGGNDGASSNRAYCATGPNRAGGSGGAAVCTDWNTGGTVSAAGGSGGTSVRPIWGVENGAGANGAGPSPGVGGAGGDSLQLNTSTCSVASGATIDPAAGLPGNAGSDASGASGAGDADGMAVAGVRQWRGVGGTSAGHGGQGSGGGGGGAAAGGEQGNAFDCVNGSRSVVTSWLCDGDNDCGDNSDETGPAGFCSNPTNFPRCYWGAAGGGGGAGGCGGQGGGAGSAGGGSFAVMLWFDATPSSTAVMPIVRSNRLNRGNGGRGGGGGIGGGGGDPGDGGRGGVGLEEGAWGFCMFDGAVGAPGGRGGHGGGGGGGAGGASYDLVVLNAVGRDPGYSGVNTFPLGVVASTGGTGGAGGNSSNTLTGTGNPGTGGDFGTVRFLN